MARTDFAAEVDFAIDRCGRLEVETGAGGCARKVCGEEVKSAKVDLLVGGVDGLARPVAHFLFGVHGWLIGLCV